MLPTSEKPVPRRLIGRSAAAAHIAALTAAALLVPGAFARADTSTSSNWAGYAAHRTGTTFRTASASWRQPGGSCATAIDDGYSAFWVGVGGYRAGSDALEQIGTELDCASDGVATLAAWYELVPAASRAIHLTVRAGDRVTASVAIAGAKVTLRLADVTRKESFARTITDHDLDLGSAEWVAEAPSQCLGSNCAVLPLADFGTVHFLNAGAVTSTGRRAAVRSSHWTTTRITLGDSQRTLSSGDVVSTTRVTAKPSALTAASGAFSVAYAATTSTSTRGGGAPAPIGAGGPPTSTARVSR